MSGPLTMRLLWLWVLTREVQNTKWYSTWPSEFLKPNLRFQGSFAYSAKIISCPVPNWIEMGTQALFNVSNRNTGNTKQWRTRWISILNSVKYWEKQRLFPEPWSASTKGGAFSANNVLPFWEEPQICFHTPSLKSASRTLSGGIYWLLLIWRWPIGPTVGLHYSKT